MFVSNIHLQQKRPVLENIDVHIKSGETIGIIGGTGSAKSSFVQLIPRLYDVTEGTVRVGKEDVRDYDLVTLRDSVAMVYRRTCYSQVRLRIISVGVIRTQR